MGDQGQPLERTKAGPDAWCLFCCRQVLKLAQRLFTESGPMTRQSRICKEPIRVY